MSIKSAKLSTLALLENTNEIKIDEGDSKSEIERGRVREKERQRDRESEGERKIEGDWEPQ